MGEARVWNADLTLHSSGGQAPAVQRHVCRAGPVPHAAVAIAVSAGIGLKTWVLVAQYQSYSVRPQVVDGFELDHGRPGSAVASVVALAEALHARPGWRAPTHPQTRPPCHRWATAALLCFNDLQHSAAIEYCVHADRQHKHSLQQQAMLQCRAGMVEQTISHRLRVLANQLQAVSNPSIAIQLKKEMS